MEWTDHGRLFKLPIKIGQGPVGSSPRRRAHDHKSQPRMFRHVNTEIWPHYQGAGYTAAADADNEAFVFREFDRLAPLKLLYLQSKLEDGVDETHHAAETGDISAMMAARNIENLVIQARQGPPDVLGGRQVEDRARQRASGEDRRESEAEVT